MFRAAGLIAYDIGVTQGNPECTAFIQCQILLTLDIMFSSLSFFGAVMASRSSVRHMSSAVNVKLLINGKTVDSSATEFIEVINPVRSCRLTDP
jgi:hypothetical protein